MANYGDYKELDHVRQCIATSNWQLEELSVELSNRCAVRCIHCSSGSQPKAMPDELTFEEHKRVMLEARQLGASILSLSGGDPILIPNLPEYVEYALRIGFERVLLYTTGIWRVDLDFVDGRCNSAHPILVNQEHVQWGISGFQTYPQLDELMQFKDDGLVIISSLHSHDASTNDYIMKMPGAFRVITQGIKHLTSNGVEVWTHFVPMQPNIDHIKKTRDLCAELGVGKMSLLRFVPQTRGFANKGALLPSLEMFDRMQKTIDCELAHPERKDLPTAIRAGCPADFRHATIGTSINNVGTGKVKSCHAGVDLILVRPTGAIHPCAAWKSLPTDSNVRTHSLQEVWAGDATYNAIREYLRSGWFFLKGACSTCAALDSCRGGCPAQRLHAFGRELNDLHYPEADPMCPTRLRDLERHSNNSGLVVVPAD